jgi:hypothetical protein
LVHNSDTVMSGLFDCAAYPCASDTHAPNGDYATRDDDVDYWKTQFSQVCPTIVSVRAPEPLELSWVDEAGNVLDTVESVDPLRMMGVNTAWTVSGGRGSSYIQAVSHDCDSPRTCPEDDVFAPNHNATRSVPVTWNIPADLAACGLDAWFRLPPIPDGCAGIVDVQLLGDGIVRGRIVDETGVSVGGITNIGSGSTDFIDDAEAQYYVKVAAQHGSDDGYDIDFLLECT